MEHFRGPLDGGNLGDLNQEIWGVTGGCTSSCTGGYNYATACATTEHKQIPIILTSFSNNGFRCMPDHPPSTRFREGGQVYAQKGQLEKLEIMGIRKGFGRSEY